MYIFNWLLANSVPCMVFAEKGKRMQCPYCVKTFVHKFRMLEHIRISHIEGKDSPYDSDPTWSIYSQHSLPNFSLYSAPCTSTPKKKRGRKPKPKKNTKSVGPQIHQDVEPQIIVSDIQQDVEPQIIVQEMEITSAPADNSGEISTDSVLIKEESTLDITDSVNVASEYNDVLKVIF